MSEIIKKTSPEVRAAIKRRTAAMLPDRPSQQGFKPADIRAALYEAIISDKGACVMGELDRIVDEINRLLDEKITETGSVTIPVAEWSDTTPKTATLTIPEAVKGTAVILAPSDDVSQTVAKSAKLYASANVTDGQIRLQRADDETVPLLDIHLSYIVLKTGGDEPTMVFLGGVDAYGKGGASGVDADAVERLIREVVPEWAMDKNPPEVSKSAVGLGNVVNERQYSAENPPPYPVTSVNGQGGTVNLHIPGTAAEVGAEKAGAVNTHDTDPNAHGRIRADLTNLQTDFSALVGTDTGKTIRAIAALVIAESLASGGESFDSLQEIAAWIKDHPGDVSAMVKRIDDLETAMGGKVSTADIVNNLTTNATNKPLSAAQGVALKALIDALIDVVKGKQTEEQVNALIASALKSAQNSGEFDGKSAYQYAVAGGYVGTEAAFTQKLAAEIPTALPNPNKLIINGIKYDGSSEVELQLDDVDIVESVDDMGDPVNNSKYFAMKNESGTGDIWWAVYHKGNTNWLPIAYTSATDHSPYNGIGYMTGKRIVGTTGEVVTQTNALITGYIPIKPGDIVRFRNIVMDNTNYGCIAPYYDENGNILSNQHAGYTSGTGGNVVKKDNGDFELIIPSDKSALSTARYIRLQLSYKSGVPDPATGIVTVNEEITDYATGWYWEDSGIDTSLGNDTAHLELVKRVNAIEERLDGGKSGGVSEYTDIPDYWNEHISEKIAEIKEAQALAGQRCVTWGVITDMHDSSNRGKSGAIMRHIANECGINAVLVLGDLSRRDTKPDKAAAVQTIKNAWNILAPIRDKVLAVRGNHDGGYGSADATLLLPSEVDDLITYPMTTSLEIHWDAVGSGYYADDKGAKVRYIMLNTNHRGANPDSTSASYMNVYRYTQAQFDMVKTALSTIPNDSWSAIVASHIPPVASVDRYGDGVWVNDISANFADMVAMRRLIAAYISRTSVTVSAAGTYGWDEVSLTADFSAAKGRLIEYNAAHLHVYKELAADYNDPGTSETLGIPVTIFRCDGFNENHLDDDTELDDEYAAQRVTGTTTEQCVYVNVANINTGEVTHIQIGVQEPT